MSRDGATVDYPNTFAITSLMRFCEACWIGNWAATGIHCDATCRNSSVDGCSSFQSVTFLPRYLQWCSVYRHLSLLHMQCAPARIA
jgi:hypothetical protein